MIKNKIQFLKHLISEIEVTISNKESYSLNNNKSIKNSNTHDINHYELLNNGQLPPDLIKELGFFIQMYGDELIYFINVNCPPMLFLKAISAFIVQKEKYRFKELKSELNCYIDLEDVSDYRFVDYLTLGYSFYDSLYFVYMNRYQINRHNVWGLVSNTEYEKPRMLIKEVIEIKTTRTKIKNKPKT